MAEPDFRNLCKELADELEEWIDGYLMSDHPDEHTDAAYAMIERARDALAQPTPEPPTDLELDSLYAQTVAHGGTQNWRAYARAVLARWGQGNG